MTMRNLTSNHWGQKNNVESHIEPRSLGLITLQEFLASTQTELIDQWIKGTLSGPFLRGISWTLVPKPWASLVAQTVKNLPAMQETWILSLGQEDSLEKEMATHSSILAWEIPWTEEPGRLQSMGPRVTNVTTKTHWWSSESGYN